MRYLLLLGLLACDPKPPTPSTTIDVGAYTAEQLACVEKEPTTACQADRAACKERIDTCRASVKVKYGR